MSPHPVDLADVQGVMRFSHGRLPVGRFMLLRIRDAAAAGAWLRTAPVTSAQAVPPDQRSPTALQVAFSADGLRQLGLAESVIAGFSHEFRTGMATEHRTRLLGDVGTNAPRHWKWGSGGREPHVLVMCYGTTDSIDAFVDSVTGSGWANAFEVLQPLEARVDRREPFGFVDGISQPTVDWDQTREAPSAQVEFTNVVALGEFLLGYPNEYGKITDRPLLAPDERSSALPSALDEPGKKDLGRNGTYLVMRQLEQDVRGFWRFVTDASGGDATAGRELAEAMVGRGIDGDPLVSLRDTPVPGERHGQNQFTYDEDVSGGRCPLGAHVRRANPRNTDFPVRRLGLLKKILIMLGFGPRGYRDDLISSVRFHRLLRRGRTYGPGLSPEDALQPAPPGDPERGLLFVALNANISRQFEFVQNAWMANTRFDGTTGESDPLVGTRGSVAGCPATSDFTLPREGGVRRRISSVPQFTTLVGGGYFFLPGLSALRYIAGSGG